MKTTAKHIQTAKTRQQTIKAAAGASRVCETTDGCLQPVGKVDPYLFHHAAAANPDVGYDIWNQPEWVNDQIRRHPELGASVQANAVFGYSGQDRMSNVCRNRLGRVKARYVFRDGHMVQVGGNA